MSSWEVEGERMATNTIQELLAQGGATEQMLAAYCVMAGDYKAATALHAASLLSGGVGDSFSEAAGEIYVASASGEAYPIVDKLVRIYMVNTSDEDVTVALGASATLKILAGSAMTTELFTASSSGGAPTYDVTFAAGISSGGFSINFTA